MKYFKIALRRNEKHELVYPENYQREVGDFNKGHLYFEENGQNYLLMCIEDKDATKTLRTFIEEITEAQAKAISEANEERREIVTNEATVKRLAIKAQLGQTLTAQELKALDPDDKTPGFGKQEILADKIEKIKAKEIK